MLRPPGVLPSLVVLALSIGLVAPPSGRAEPVAVRIEPLQDAPAFTVSVGSTGGAACTAPCELALEPGRATLQLAGASVHPQRLVAEIPPRGGTLRVRPVSAARRRAGVALLATMGVTLVIAVATIGYGAWAIAQPANPDAPGGDDGPMIRGMAGLVPGSLFALISIGLAGGGGYLVAQQPTVELRF